MPNQNVPNLKELPENDPIDFDDSLIGFHPQAGLVDKSWILFDSGACANCCPEWFAPDYPTLRECTITAELVWKDTGCARKEDCAA